MQIIRVATGFSYAEWGSNFDIYFTGSGDVANNHILLLKIELCLQQILVPPPQINDASSNPFNIQAWTTGEWAAFKLLVGTQAAFWHRRFVLVPPRSCEDLMYRTGTASGFGKLLGTEFDYMPNVECHFDLTVSDAPAGAHRTVRVARLSDAYPLATMDSSSFRSHATLYDSLDGMVHVFDIPDNVGTVHHIQHYTIPHEIGHALGLGHIGQLKKTTACQTAISSPTPGNNLQKGGSNSLVCYGWGEAPSISENIMGFGTALDEVNADPWRNAMARLTRTNAGDWSVSIGSYLGPKCVYSS